MELENLFLEATKVSPLIVMQTNGELIIKGRSTLSDGIFYQKVIDWLEQYSVTPQEKTQLTIQMDYFNSTSSRYLLTVFRTLEYLMKTKRSDCKIIWVYEKDDFDLEEAGKEYAYLADVPFEFKQIETT